MGIAAASNDTTDAGNDCDAAYFHVLVASTSRVLGQHNSAIMVSETPSVYNVGMCGRFTLRTPTSLLIQHFQLTLPELRPRYNIAPTQDVPTIARTPDSSERQYFAMRWGLVPSWAKDVSIGNRMINARGESVATKPSFRSAFSRRRCLVLADGYYEWRKEGKIKQPYYIRMRDDKPFAMAGLWEKWSGSLKGAEHQSLKTCTVITIRSNDLTCDLHDRMPVILDPTDYDRWLDPNCEEPRELEGLLEPFESEMMTLDPVSTHVNSPRNEDEKCIEIQQQLF